MVTMAELMIISNDNAMLASFFLYTVAAIVLQYE